MSNQVPRKIGEIPFKDISIAVYHDQYSKEPSASCIWRMRNPDSCYQGIVFMDWETCKMTYPEGAVIPEQTDKDREILPQFIITAKTEIDDELLEYTNQYLERDYKRRNGIKDE